MDAQHQTEAVPYPSLSLPELFALDLPEPEWVVDGLLPLGHAGLLSGREKSGKGLLMIDLLASISGDQSWLGRSTKQGPVIYCAAEESVRDVRDRVQARIGDERDIPFYTLPLSGETEDRLSLASPDDLSRLVAMIDHREPLLVALDPLRELHDLRENDADDMAPLLAPLRQISHQRNLSILTSHHMNRTGSFRGSTAILAAVDFDWSFTDETEDGDPHGTLRYKGRRGRRVAVDISLGDGGRWIETGFATATAPEDETVLNRILAYLAGRDGATAKQIAFDLGGGLGTVQNNMTRLAKDGHVVFTGGARRGSPRVYFCAATVQTRL